METIRVEGEIGLIRFVPGRITQSHILKIERQLKKLLKAKEDYLTTSEMRQILKEKDPLIGTIGGTVRAYRNREGFTQQELARRSGIKQSHISEIEKNRRPVGLQVAKKLAKALNVDYRRFL